MVDICPNMLITLLRNKIHRAVVTDGCVDYEGSLTIPSDLANLVGFFEYEKILVGNITSGERFETYVIFGPSGSGSFILNGATAHLGKVGDRLVIMSFVQLSEEDAARHTPKTIVLDESNRVIQRR